MARRRHPVACRARVPGGRALHDHRRNPRRHRRIRSPVWPASALTKRNCFIVLRSVARDFGFGLHQPVRRFFRCHRLSDASSRPPWVRRHRRTRPVHRRRHVSSSRATRRWTRIRNRRLDCSEIVRTEWSPVWRHTALWTVQSRGHLIRVRIGFFRDWRNRARGPAETRHFGRDVRCRPARSSGPTVISYPLVDRRGRCRPARRWVVSHWAMALARRTTAVAPGTATTRARPATSERRDLPNRTVTRLDVPIWPESGQTSPKPQLKTRSYVFSS